MANLIIKIIKYCIREKWTRNILLHWCHEQNVQKFRKSGVHQLFFQEVLIGQQRIEVVGHSESRPIGRKTQ